MTALQYIELKKAVIKDLCRLPTLTFAREAVATYFGDVIYYEGERYEIRFKDLVQIQFSREMGNEELIKLCSQTILHEIVKISTGRNSLENFYNNYDGL